MWPGGGQDQEVGFELLGKSQPHDVRKKGVSGRGTGKGKNPEVGRSWCVGGTEMRQGPKRLGDIRMGGKMGSLAGGHGVPGENLHGQSWAETPLSSPPAPLPCARDFQGPLTGFLEKVLPPHLRGEGLS